MTYPETAQSGGIDRRTVLKTLGAGAIAGVASTGTGLAARGHGPKQVLEIVTEHDHSSGEHLFQLSTHELPAGWNTLVLDNRTSHTHFAYTVKLPQAALDDAAAEGLDPLEFYVETVTRPFQYFADTLFGKTPDPADNTDYYASLFPPWFGDVAFYGAPGLTSGGLDSTTTVAFDPGTYVVECYVKDDANDFHSYLGMIDAFTVTSDASRAAEPDSTVTLELSAAGIEFPDVVRPGRHTVAVEFLDQSTYTNLVGHDVHLVRLDGDSTSAVNDWMNWADPTAFIADGTEPAPFLGGVQDIWTAPASDHQGTGYHHVGLGAGEYAWVAEVPDPASKGLLHTFSVVPPGRS